jgi:hypothetical protein
LLLRASSHSG